MTVTARHPILYCLIGLLLSVNNICGQPNQTMKVVIDAGHGGRDPGALGSKTKEKDITLAIALKVGNYIKENLPDVSVIYTRDKDVFVDLVERARIANSNHADLFISIHANWISNPKIGGTETYVLGLHRSNENLEVAKKENSVIVLEDDYSTKYEGFDPNSAESYIIFELLQNSFLDQSIFMATLVENQFSKRAGRYSRGVKQAGFLVLRETAMPSILIEAGYLTNQSEEAYIASDEGQSIIASAIYRAFKEYKADHDSKSILIEAKEPVVVEKETPAIVTPIDMPVVFRIQIASSTNKLNENHKIFKEFNEVWMYEEGGKFKYTIRQSDKLDEIKQQLQEVKKSIPDAFVVAFDRNKHISIDKAQKLLDKNSR